MRSAGWSTRNTCWKARACCRRCAVRRKSNCDAVFAEIGYSFKPARKYTGKEPAEARGYGTPPLKYLLWEGYRSQLFDLENDPNEFDDLGESADHANIRAELHERLFRWLRTRATRITISEAVRNRTGGAPKRASSSANGRPRKPSKVTLTPTTGWVRDGITGAPQDESAISFQSILVPPALRK